MLKEKLVQKVFGLLSSHFHSYKLSADFLESGQRHWVHTAGTIVTLGPSPHSTTIILHCLLRYCYPFATLVYSSVTEGDNH